MPQLLVVTHVTTASTEARDEFIKAAEKVAIYAKASQAGVTKFLITVPRDEKDGEYSHQFGQMSVDIKIDDTHDKTVWLIEEFADQASADAHNATQGVQDMLALPGDLVSYKLENICGFTRPEVMETTNPQHMDSPYLMTFDTVTFRPGEFEKTLPLCKAVHDISHDDEPDTLLYALYKNPTKPDNFHALEVYASEPFLWDVHCKSAPATACEEVMGARIESNSHAFLRFVSGYWFK